MTVVTIRRSKLVQKNNIASFTFTELFRDLNHDKIFLYILSYEYSLNFNQVLTLYEFSPEIFWSYINILKPLLKVGDRKAQMLKKSANNVYYTLLGNKLNLSQKENDYITYLSQYINDSFSDGEVCYHYKSIDKFPIKATGYFSNGNNRSTIQIKNKEDLFKYIDSIEYIEYKKKILTKTSRLSFMLEKYYPDITVKELRLKNVKELIQMLNKESVEEHYKYLESLDIAREQARRERVYGKEEKVLH